MNLFGQFSLKTLIAFISFFFFAQAMNGQKLVARTDAREVLVQNTFEVVFEIGGASVNSFKPPSFKGLEIVSGPFRGVERSIYNGKVTRKSTFSYTLAGLKPGTFNIGPASVVSKGLTIQSNSLTVKVVAQLTSKKGDFDAVYLETVVLDTPAYPGSQVNISYVLHTSINLADMSLRSEDDYQSFIVRNLKVDENGQYEVKNGKQYLRKVIKQVALYPTEAGQVKLKPMAINIEVPEKGQSRRTGLMDQFFSTTRYKTKILMSDPVDIRTEKFPRPIPKNFSGASGRLEMKTTLGDDVITTDDAVSLKVVLMGTSNPTEIKAPFIEISDELTVFPAKVVQDTILQRDGQLAFQKTFDFLIQPQKVGKYIFFVKTSYFDTVSESFKELKSPILTLNVGQGSRPIGEEADEEKTSVSYMPFVWGILGLLVLLFGWFVWTRSQQKILAPNENEAAIETESKHLDTKPIEALETFKSKPVPMQADKAFVLSKHIAGKEYLQEVLNITEQYLGAQLALPHARFRKSQVFDLLTEKGNSAEKIQALKEWWGQVETAIYANKPMNDHDEAHVLEEIKAILALLKY